MSVHDDGAFGFFDGDESDLCRRCNDYPCRCNEDSDDIADGRYDPEWSVTE